MPTSVDRHLDTGKNPKGFLLFFTENDLLEHAKQITHFQPSDVAVYLIQRSLESRVIALIRSGGGVAAYQKGFYLCESVIVTDSDFL